jgi:hypothetical protein
MGHDFYQGIYFIAFPVMNILKNRLFAATLMFLLLDLAGSFLILAPLLVVLRNRFEHSAEALSLWPTIKTLTVTDILVNDTQMIATFVISAIVIFFIFMLLRTFFSGGIYGIIILKERPVGDGEANPFKSFLTRSAEIWPGFIKISLFSILVYFVAIFIGAILSRIVSGLGFFWQAAVFLFFMMVGSTYIQVLQSEMVVSGQTSVSRAISSTRSAVARGMARLIAGNLSVVMVGAIAAWILWLILAWIRGYAWNMGLTVLSIILEQGIVFVICLMQVIRINYNSSIIRRGTQDVVGGTELGGV